jgi:hypothetical protein
MCEVQLTEESPDDDDDRIEINTSSRRPSNTSFVEPPMKKHTSFSAYNNHIDKSPTFNNDRKHLLDMPTPSLTINNVATTLDALNLIKNQFNQQIQNDFKNSYVQTKKLQDEDAASKDMLEMKQKEHLLKLQILETELETAKLNRDIAEINKKILLKKFDETWNHNNNR